MPIIFETTGTGDSSLPTTIPDEKHAVSNGSNLVESDMQETDTQISTNKDFFARTLTAAQASIEIGPALTLSAGGGEVLQRSIFTDTGEVSSILPRKRYDNLTGTAGEFTNGRILGPQQTITLFSGDTLRSDDITATVPPNDIAGKVVYTITPTENRFITKYFMRYATVQTGVRQVWRVGSATGAVVFETEPDRSFQDGIGVTTKIYTGTPETETVFDFLNEPLVLLEGQIYYITLESNVGDVVAFGGLEGGEFKPYTRREIQDLFADPVVSMGSLEITSDFDYNTQVFGFWYTNLFVDASAGDVEVTLNTAVGADSKSLQGYVYKTDSSANTVTVIPFGSETIDGQANYILTKENESIGLMSDGVNIHTNSKSQGDAVLNSDTSTSPMQFVLDEDDLGSNSDIKLATQQSIKTYVDNKVTSGMTYKGGYDATTNTPNLEIAPTGMVVGDFFTVTVAGTFFTTPVEVGDALIAEVDDPTVEGDWTILLRHLDAVAIKNLYESNPDTNAFTDAEKTNLGNQSGTNTGDVTLAADDTTQESLDLTGQELTANLVTTTTDGVMSAEDKVFLDNIVANGAGDDWVSGFSITEHSPRDQSVDYTSGTYLINGELKVIATGGTYDLSNGFGGINHYSDLVTSQHAFVMLYVDATQVMKSVRGVVVEQDEVPTAPPLPADSVCLAVVEIKVNSSSAPKNIFQDEIADCRNTQSINTDEFVSISADDTTKGHLATKLVSDGNVTFTIQNPGSSETLKGDVDIAGDSAVAANTAKVSFPEAPIDGTPYARKDGAWAAVAGGGDMLKSTYDPTSVNGDAFDMENMTEGTNNKILTAAERTKLDGLGSIASGYATGATNTTCTLADTYYKVEAPFTTITMDGWSWNGTLFRWERTGGAIAPGIIITFTGSHDDVASAHPVKWAVFHNGSPVVTPPAGAEIDKGASNSITLTCPSVSVATNDYIELFVKVVDDGGDDAITTDINLLIR